MKNLKNLSKRGLSLLLVLVMCVSLLNITVFAEETDIVCGKTAHTHSIEAGCYKVDCGIEVGSGADAGHKHTDACYKSTEPICGENERPADDGHEHTDACYNLESLTCEQDEGEGAVEGHTHTAECGETKTYGCGEEEREAVAGHTHEDCEQDEDGNYICGEEEHEAVAGHEHTDVCGVTVTYGCGEEEREAVAGHEHSNACYERTCTENERPADKGHEHTSDCYVSETPVCNETEREPVAGHAHEDKCYDTSNATCGKDEHTHTASCKSAVEVTGLEGLKAQMSGGKLNRSVNVTGTIEINGNFTLDLNGCTVKLTAGSGSVFKVNSGTFTLKDTSGETKTITADGEKYEVDKGTIKGGKGTSGRWADHTVGGGVYVGQGATFTMYGGSIQGNTAGAGGGIYVDIDTNENNPGHLNIYGGSISKNSATASAATTAVDGGGGGIWINGIAVIDPAHIENGVVVGRDVTIVGNTSATTTDLGGGGIYVNNCAKLGLYNAIITGNTADGLGGGLASCVHGKISVINVGENGAAIYGNTAKGTAHDNAASGKVGWAPSLGAYVDGHSKWTGTKGNAFRAAAQDIFSAGNAKAGNSGIVVSKLRPQNQNALWSGYVMNNSDETKFTAVNGNADYIYGGFLLGLTSGCSADPQFNRRVTISGNTSKTHGGGIGCNGTLTMSFENSGNKETQTKAVNGEMTLNVAKVFAGVDLSKHSFTFNLLNANKDVANPVDTGTTDANGNVTLSFADGLNAPGIYTFYVQEVDGGNTNITYNTTAYEVKVNVALDTSKGTNGVETIVVAGTTVKVTNYKATVLSVGGQEVQKNTVTVDSVDLNGNPTSYTVVVPTFNVTNEWKTGALKIAKTVTGAEHGEDQNDYTFTVDLTRPAGVSINPTKYTVININDNGEQVGESVERDFNGTVTLKHNQIATIAGVPYGTTYSVTENDGDPADAFTGTVTSGSGTGTGTINSDETNVVVTNAMNYGQLWISKEVVDASGIVEPHEKFVFTVKLNAENTVYADTLFDYAVYEQGSDVAVNTGEVGDNGTIELERNQIAKIVNIPAGLVSNVKETGDNVEHFIVTGSNVETNQTITKDGTVVVEFTNTRKVVSLSIKKVVEGTNVDGTAKIDGADYTFTIKIGDSDAKRSFKNGDEFNGYGVYTFILKENETKTIVNIPTDTKYTVKEIAADSGYNVDGEATLEGYTVDGEVTAKIEDDFIVSVNGQPVPGITVTNTRNDGNLSIEKVVEGAPKSSTAAAEFTFTINGPVDANGKYEAEGAGYEAVTFANGVATVVIKGQDVLDKNGKVTIKGLPTGKYDVTEDEKAADVAIPGYYLSSVNYETPDEGVKKKGECEVKVTNLYAPYSEAQKTKLTVVKVWEGDEGIERPTKVTVQLYKDGIAYNGAVTLNKGNNWSHTWNNLDAEHDWTVEELNVPEGYDSFPDSVTNEDGTTTWTITNTYTKTPLLGILSVNKVWAGDAGVNRPDSVSVEIYKDGQVFETVTLNDGNQWAWNYILNEEELKAEHKWSVSEINIPEGYKSEVSVDANGMSFTVTNTYKEPEIPENPGDPEEEIPEPGVPLAPWSPENGIPEEEIPEDEIPLAPWTPEEEIPDEDVPMIGVPQTGDISMGWYAAAVLSLCGLAVLTLKKREENEG